MPYDLLVLGRTRAGHDAALAGAALGLKVGLIEPLQRQCGGIRVGDDLLPFEALDALSDLPEFLRATNARQVSARYGEIDLDQIRRQVVWLNRQDQKAFRLQQRRSRIATFTGTPVFQGSNSVEVWQVDGTTRVLEADRIVLACGTRAMRPAAIPFDGQRVFDADELFGLDRLPRQVHVVGGSTTGLRCASFLAGLGVQVTVIDGCTELSEIVGRDDLEGTSELAIERGVRFSLGEEVIRVEPKSAGRLTLHMESGTRIAAQSVLVAVGRVGDTASLQLARAGLRPDERGRLWCNAHQQTWVSHIYAAGDVMGFSGAVQASRQSIYQSIRHAFARRLAAIRGPGL